LSHLNVSSYVKDLTTLHRLWSLVYELYTKQEIEKHHIFNNFDDADLTYLSLIN
jgi:hypothetical protein